ncbi:MAG: hypothetical protein AAGH40_02690 [Verrucomicrobiota bacterium]
MHLRLVFLLLPLLGLFVSTEALFTAKEWIKAEKAISCESAEWAGREPLLLDLITVEAKRIVRLKAELDATGASVRTLYLGLGQACYPAPDDAGHGVPQVGGRQWISETHLRGPIEGPQAGALDKLERRIELFATSTDQLEKLFGGQHYSGKALSPDGGIYGGSFLQIGPLLYFVSENGELAGSVEATRS